MEHLNGIIIILALLHIPLYFLWGWVLFRSWESFWDAVCFLFKPEIWSLFNGEYWDNIMAEAKLALWFWGPTILFTLELQWFGLISE